MNFREFAALKTGDKIENPMAPNSVAEVVEVTDSGVRIMWSGTSTRFFYSVQSTAWMHWTYAPRDCTAGPCYREDCRQGDRCLYVATAAKGATAS